MEVKFGVTSGHRRVLLIPRDESERCLANQRRFERISPSGRFYEPSPSHEPAVGIVDYDILECSPGISNRQGYGVNARHRVSVCASDNATSSLRGESPAGIAAVIPTPRRSIVSAFIRKHDACL